MNKLNGKSVAIFGHARSGSTYIANCIHELYKLSDVHDSLLFGDIFGLMYRDTVKDTIVETEYDITGMSYQESNFELCDMLLKNSVPYIFKVMIPHRVLSSNLKAINEIINRNDFVKIFVYRESVEESILSFIYALKTNLFHSYNETKLNKIKYDEKARGILNFNLSSLYMSYVFYKSYQSDWDYVIKYESLNEAPIDDFGMFFDLNTIEKLEDNYLKKISTMEEKIDNFDGYEEFKKEFFEKINDKHQIYFGFNKNPIERCDLEKYRRNEKF